MIHLTLVVPLETSENDAMNAKSFPPAARAAIDAEVSVLVGSRLKNETVEISDSPALTSEYRPKRVTPKRVHYAVKAASFAR